jgi:hypothetical protein
MGFVPLFFLPGISDPIDLPFVTNALCPPSAAYKSMLAQADALERTWNPTGVYTWQDMSNVVAATVGLAKLASDAGVRFFSGNSMPSARDKVRDAADHYNSIAKRSLDYTEAWKTAKAAGKPVSAPGFKRWVIDDLRAAAELFRAVEVAVCKEPWWLSSAVAISGAFISVVDVAKRVVGAVLTVAEGAVKAAERTGDIVGFLLSWGPYLALGVGGYLVYKKVRK